jgi:Prophage CP4-57 regulatory protein (AlpA).
MQQQTHQLPATGFLRLAQIVGNPKANPPIPAIIPVSRSTFLNWEKTGKAPKSIKLGERTTAWRVSDIRDLIDKLGETKAAGGAK